MTVRWQDLSAELYPHQLDELQRLEDGGSDAESLLQLARHYASRNLGSAVQFGLITAPADAVWISAWSTDTDANIYRDWSAARRSVAGVEVYVAGRQFLDGSTEQGLTVVAAEGVSLTKRQTRELADVLHYLARQL